MATPEPNDVKHIEVIARGLIIANNALLLCRNVAGGYWYLPGGHVEPGESAAEALSRELVEEADLRSSVQRCVAIHEHRFVQGAKRRHEYNLVFHVERLTDAAGRDLLAAGARTEIASCEDAIAFDWIGQASLADTNLQPAAMRDWLKNTQHVCESTNIAWIADSH